MFRVLRHRFSYGIHTAETFFCVECLHTSVSLFKDLGNSIAMYQNITARGPLTYSLPLQCQEHIPSKRRRRDDLQQNENQPYLQVNFLLPPQLRLSLNPD